MQGDFSNAFYYSGISAYIKPDSSVSRIEDLNSPSATLAIMDGEMTSVIAREHFPKARTISLSHDTPIPDLLMNVTMGKADATFVEDDVANKFLSKNPGSLKKLDTVFAVPNSFLLPHGQESFKAALNNGIELLNNSGFIEKTLLAYEDVPNTLLRIAKPYAT